MKDLQQLPPPPQQDLAAYLAYRREELRAGFDSTSSDEYDPHSRSQSE